jgi:hypothetical protein
MNHAEEILKKIFASHEIYWCYGRKEHVVSSKGPKEGDPFFTIDGRTDITEEELAYLDALNTEVHSGS